MVVLYLALVCTVFAFLVQSLAVQHSTGARVSLLLGTEPLWAAMFGVAVGGDAVTAMGVGGVAVVVGGTFWGRRVLTSANEKTPRIYPSKSHEAAIFDQETKPPKTYITI